MPASRSRWICLLLLTTFSSATSQRVSAQEPAKAPEPTATATPHDADEPPPPDTPLPEIDDTWTVSRDPAKRYWHIASYLKGTADEIRNTLDAQVVDFDDKLVGVLTDIAQNEREAKFQTEEALAAARGSASYKAIQAQADAAKAELDAVRASGAAIDRRMAASSKYNRFKSELDKLERQAIARTSVASLKAAREKLEARADTFYTKRSEAFAWRRKLVNAILLGQTLRGRLVPGETVGLLKGAAVEQIRDDRTVVARFPLMLGHEVIGEKEGVKQIQGRVQQVRLLIRGLDDVHRLQPKLPLDNWQVFKVTGTQQVDGETAYVVEPYPCDFNYLLTTILKPPKLKAPPRAIIGRPAEPKQPLKRQP